MSTGGDVRAAQSLELTANQCQDELDTAVALFNDDAHAAAKILLTQLADDCQLPQIHHNLGVIAGLQDQWSQAIKHFEQSLAADQRAAMTQDHLRQIYRYRANIAYGKALNTEVAAQHPNLQVQDSSVINANAVRREQPSTARHRISDVDYELYDWWVAAANNNREGVLAHYVRGYPAPDIAARANINWDQVQREISFTAEDAIAVLTHSEKGETVSTLLLLRLQGNRWKIYQETRL